VLRALGVKWALDTFPQRIVVQKAIFLAQERGAHLGYFYSWYLRGPYSSAVAHDLFSALAHPDLDSSLRSWRLDPETESLLTGLRPLLTPPSELSFTDQAKWLELLASMRFLQRRLGGPTEPQDLCKRLEQQGKSFAVEDIALASKALCDAGLC